MNTKKLGKWLGAAFLLLMWMLYRSSTWSNTEKSDQATTFTTPITPSEWTCIPTKGKDLHFSITPTNGVKLKYTVVLDGNMSNKFVFPGTNIPPHLYYGVTNLWVKLNSGQIHNVGYLSYYWTD